MLLPGVLGSVRALEVTHGQANGWHPHLHVLVFLDGPVDLAKWTAVLLAHWAKVTKRHGLADVNEHGLRLDDGSKAALYASKWGLEDEMTKAHLKQGRKGGNRTPWALLADYSAGDKQAGHLFREFFDAFSRRHQLVWSRGLRAHFGLGVEKSDEELAAEKVEALDVLVARLTPEDWKLIRKHNLRGQVLELLRTATWEAVDLLLGHYRPHPPTVSHTRATGSARRAGREEARLPDRERSPLSDDCAGSAESSSDAESRTAASDRGTGARRATDGALSEGRPPARRRVLQTADILQLVGRT